MVWIVSILPLISNSSNLLFKFSETVPSTPIIIYITVNFMFHSFFCYFFHSVVSWNSKIHKFFFPLLTLDLYYDYYYHYWLIPNVCLNYNLDMSQNLDCMRLMKVYHGCGWWLLLLGNSEICKLTPFLLLLLLLTPFTCLLFVSRSY